MLQVMCCYQTSILLVVWGCWTTMKGKTCEETARSHLDWSE
jgi:hypothetical protein